MSSCVMAVPFGATLLNSATIESTLSGHIGAGMLPPLVTCQGMLGVLKAVGLACGVGTCFIASTFILLLAQLLSIH